MYYLKQIFYSLGQTLISKQPVKIMKRAGKYYYNGKLLSKQYLKRRIGWDDYENLLIFDFEISKIPFEN